jgi:hypothetical protein
LAQARLDERLHGRAVARGETPGFGHQGIANIDGGLHMGSHTAA